MGPFIPIIRPDLVYGQNPDLATVLNNINTTLTNLQKSIDNQQKKKPPTDSDRSNNFKGALENVGKVLKILGGIGSDDNLISKTGSAITKFAGPATDFLKIIGAFKGEGVKGIGNSIKDLFSGKTIGRPILESLGFGVRTEGEKAWHLLHTGERLGDYTPAGKATLGLASAAMGGLEGYSMGQSFGGLGALGGTVSGALSGAMMFGPVGAIAGGAGGLIGGLLGWLIGGRSKKELKRLETVTKKAEAGLTNASYQVDLVEKQAKQAKFMNELQEVKSRADNVVYLTDRKHLKKAA